MISIPLQTVCAYCGRPRFLWGGDSCDICDMDSDGINDRDEPIALTTVGSQTLFQPAETGFVVTEHGLRMSVSDWSLLSPEMKAHVSTIISKKYKGKSCN